MQVNNVQSFGVRSTLFTHRGKTTGLFLSYLGNLNKASSILGALSVQGCNTTIQQMASNNFLILSPKSTGDVHKIIRILKGI